MQLEEKSESKKSKSQASKQSNSKSQSIKQSEKNSMNNKEKKSENIENNVNKQPEQQVLSTRAYLEQNVTPVVQEALLECARKRPNNPLEFVGNYILNRAHGK